MADIFEQVDEALRTDRMKTLWRRYGWMVIALAVLIVAGTAAVVAWRSYERGVAEEETNALTETFIAAAAEEPAEAIATLTAFADQAKPDIGALARLQAAARALNADDRPTAIDLYRQVADNAEVDPVLRELATMLAASLSVGSEDLDSLRGRLAGMEASNSPWRYLAGEIIAAAAIAAGDMELARERLTAISDDPDAPINLRGRAAELLAAIGGGPEAEAAPEEQEATDPAPEETMPEGIAPEGEATPSEGDAPAPDGEAAEDGAEAVPGEQEVTEPAPEGTTTPEGTVLEDEAAPSEGDAPAPAGEAAEPAPAPAEDAEPEGANQ